MTEISQTPGVVGVICTDPQGLSLAARGTLKPESSGLVSGLATQAASLNLGNGEDDKPTIVVEFDTGNILIRGQQNSTLGIHKV